MLTNNVQSVAGMFSDGLTHKFTESIKSILHTHLLIKGCWFQSVLPKCLVLRPRDNDVDDLGRIFYKFIIKK